MKQFILFCFISAIAVIHSSPVPTTTRRTSDILTDPVDSYLEEWRNRFQDIHLREAKPFFDMKHPFFDMKPPFFEMKQPFEPFNQNAGAFEPPQWPFKFSDNFFKNVGESLPSDNAKNNTVENVREVDGHVIHEKESTYANGDENHRVVFKQKTVVIRPKTSTDKKLETVGNDYKPVITNEQNSEETVPKVSYHPTDVTKRQNPDDEVEMVHYPTREHPNAAIQNGIVISTNDDQIYDFRNDTRINDYYNGPMNPNAEFIDGFSKKNFNQSPNAPIRELISNDLDESNQPARSLEHDTDVNKNTLHLTTNSAAEFVDTNAIRIKRKQNKYMHHT